MTSSACMAECVITHGCTGEIAVLLIQYNKGPITLVIETLWVISFSVITL